MRVLLTAAGTRGDVQPLFGLARALQRAGHQAIVAAPPNFAREAAALGIDYRACGPDMRKLVTAHAELGANPIRLVRAARETAHADTLNHFDGLLPLAHDADVIVAAGLMFAAASVAELAKVPYRYLAYTPDVLRSDHHPPPLSDVRNFGRPINRWLWKGFAALTHWMVGRSLNQRRQQYGLPATPDVLTHAMLPAQCLLASDIELAPLPRDLQLAAPQLGNLRLDDDRPLPPELERFLQAGPAPVYFGFGSMPDAKPATTTAQIIACARALGVRAIISRGWAQLGANIDHAPDVLAIDDVTHRHLFPRVAAVVHHGGAGTTDAATFAGVPQLVVPHLLDQFGWARRVDAQHLGPKPLPRYRWAQKRLTQALAQTLGDPSYAERARQVALAVQSRDGLSAAIVALEHAAGFVSARRSAPTTTARQPVSRRPRRSARSPSQAPTAL